MITYTNYFYTLLQDLQTLLQTEFTDHPVLIGDRAVIQQYPCIILEPYDKDIDADKSSGKKDFNFHIYIWVYQTQNENEQAVSQLTDTCERIEELLIDYRENPIQDGSKWYISSPGKVKYGQINKAGELLRTAQIEWNFKKRVNRN